MTIKTVLQMLNGLEKVITDDIHGRYIKQEAQNYIVKNASPFIKGFEIIYKPGKGWTSQKYKPNKAPR